MHPRLYAPQGKRFPAIKGVQKLKDVLLNIVWTNTAYHAAINYPVKEFGSHAPTVAYALFKKPEDWSETAVGQVDRENNDILTQLLPPHSVTIV